MLLVLVAGLSCLQTVPALAQSEQALRQNFEGRFVIVRLDMPATHRGVDLHPDREPAVDFSSYSARLREFGVSIREGGRVLVTAVRVKKKNIEFHLAGGGYGVMGDDSGSVYVPTVSKSRREKDLDDQIKDERDPDRRRRLERERDQLRRERQRDERDRDAEKRDLEERKKGDIAVKRLDAGSRVNIWLPENTLASGAPTPRELERLLAPVIDFGGSDDRRSDTNARRADDDDDDDDRNGDRDGKDSRGGDGSALLRRGLSVEEVHDLLGKPARSKPGKQGDLATLSEWYEDRDRVTEVTYVSGIVVRFSTSSK